MTIASLSSLVFCYAHELSTSPPGLARVLSIPLFESILLNRLPSPRPMELSLIRLAFFREDLLVDYSNPRPAIVLCWLLPVYRNSAFQTSAAPAFLPL